MEMLFFFWQGIVQFNKDDLKYWDFAVKTQTGEELRLCSDIFRMEYEILSAVNHANVVDS